MAKLRVSLVMLMPRILNEYQEVSGRSEMTRHAVAHAVITTTKKSGPVDALVVPMARNADRQT